METSNDSKQDDINIPNYLLIGEYKYSFKKNLTNNKFSYRCFHRNCKVLITIDKINLLKINNNKNNENNTIEYFTNNKEHICQPKMPVVEDQII